MALLTILMGAGYGILQVAERSYQRVQGRGDAAVILKKAAHRMQKDLQPSNFAQTLLADVPPSLPGGGRDGMAIAMLTSAANGTGDMAVKAGGQPFYQRNIVYYLVVPQGDPCPGGADAQGYDDRCPHKMLIRKTIDSGAATTPTSPDSDEEQLLGSLAPYLTRPLQRDLSGMNGEAGLVGVELVAAGLLQMRIERAPEANFPGEVRIMFRAFNPTRGLKVAVGVDSLIGHDNTIEHPLSVFPKNNQ